MGSPTTGEARSSTTWPRRLRRQRALLLIPYTVAVAGLTMVIGYRPPTWPDRTEPLAASAPVTAPTPGHDGHASPSGSDAAAAGGSDPAGAGGAAAAAAPGTTGDTSDGATSPAPAASPAPAGSSASSASGGAAPSGSGGEGGYAPTSTTAPAPDASLDERDVRSVLGLVFDLGRPWSQKAPYIEASDVLAAPYQQLVAATTAFGAVELRVADVQVQGDEAPFTVDAYLNGALVHPGIPGTAERVGPAWRLTRSSVCGAMAVVAISCPA